MAPETMDGFLRAYSTDLFVAALGVVADELEEERDVVGAALVADALDPGVLEVVDLGLLERRVVEQDLDAVGAGFLQAADAPDVEQVGQAAGRRARRSRSSRRPAAGPCRCGAWRRAGRIRGRAGWRRRTGVSTSVTSVLKTSRSCAVGGAAARLAEDFCSEPRWSMAAAAMTPRASETAFRPASFPGVSFMHFPFTGHLRMRKNRIPSRLGLYSARCCTGEICVRCSRTSVHQARRSGAQKVAEAACELD